MYDFSELRAYAEANADALDKQDNYEKVVAQRKVEEGWVVVSHTGGGNQPENRIYDYLTGETLAVLPDTIEAVDQAWQDNWYPKDRLAQDALELFEFPKRETYLTGTGSMPEGMFNAVVKWIEEEDDASELRRFANDI